MLSGTLLPPFKPYLMSGTPGFLALSSDIARYRDKTNGKRFVPLSRSRIEEEEEEETTPVALAADLVQQRTYIRQLASHLQCNVMYCV